jgi:AraC-like DNA-binding protein/mannose-6-phosphate isomerase-like protein (cupin superfamily)
MRIPRKLCEDQVRVVEPQINAEGIHVWPFDPAFPIDVLFLSSTHGRNVRKNRHDYFEVLYVSAGAASLKIQDRSLPVHEGDLAVVGSTLYHRFECCTPSPFTMAVLFFQPDLIRADGGPDNAKYLTPFLLQDSEFPHIVPAGTGVPDQVFDLMQRIRLELPAPDPRARLAVKTYLKMILILLVNQYASYAGTVDTFERQQRSLERLRPLFEHLEKNFGDSIQVQEAARICGMSESHFMSFFKRATGQSFMAYLNHFRIERAQTLLVTTDKPMSDISQEMGFCDQSYFGTVFRKVVGMTPAAYRSKCRAEPAGQPGGHNHVPTRSLSRIAAVSGLNGKA